MEYLTVHDLVWVNNVVTGSVQPYNYVTLEAAMAGQYRYGQSTDVPGQAATLLHSLLSKPPFAAGNRRTAFLSTLTFLNANGYATRVSDQESVQVIQELEQGRITSMQAILSLAAPADGHLPAGMTLRRLITHECNLHADALRALAAGD